MSREMTNKEAISNLNQLIYGIVSPDIQRSLDLAIKALEERPKGEWIPIKYRPMTSEECKKLAEHYDIECGTFEEKTFDCPMPEDGQRILLSRSWGVDIDVADNDIDGEGFICYGLEENGDWDGVIAWMPLPEPYKKEGDEE